MKPSWTAQSWLSPSFFRAANSPTLRRRPAGRLRRPTTAQSQGGTRRARIDIRQATRRQEGVTVRYKDVRRRRGGTTGPPQETLRTGKGRGLDPDRRGPDRHVPDRGRGRRGRGRGVGRRRGGTEGGGTVRRRIGAGGGDDGRRATAPIAAIVGAGAGEGITGGDSSGIRTGKARKLLRRH
jgi:hypothetical protein